MPQPTKIDWLQARNDYVIDPTMSYAKIAESYGVSDTAVEQRAKKEDWPGLRKRLGEKAAARAEEKIVDELSEVNVRHQQSYTLIQAIALEQANILIDWIRGEKKAAELTNTRLDPRSMGSYQQFKFLADALDLGVKGERITRNMPTASVLMEHKGIIATLDLTPTQVEGIVNAREAARDVIAGEATGALPGDDTTGQNSQ